MGTEERNASGDEYGRDPTGCRSADRGETVCACIIAAVGEGRWTCCAGRVDACAGGRGRMAEWDKPDDPPPPPGPTELASACC